MYNIYEMCPTHFNGAAPVIQMHRNGSQTNYDMHKILKNMI